MSSRRPCPGRTYSPPREDARLDQYNTIGHHHWRNFVADRKNDVPLGPPPAPVDGRVSLARVYQWLLGVPEHIAWTGNETRSNIENAERLARAFPDARFVMIVRDVRDVALSWRWRWDRDELLTADKWDRRLRRGAVSSPRCRWIVHYEELLRNLEGVARTLCEFLALSFDPAMLQFHERVTKTIGGQENRGRPLKTDNHGKWRSQLSSHIVTGGAIRCAASSCKSRSTC